MRERKLVQILTRLQPEERKEFAEFLRSPLHARRPKLARMVELFEELLFQRPNHEISSEEYYAQIYPNKKYDPNNLNRLISVIMRELKNYLAFLQYRNDKGAQYTYYAKECGDRRWPDWIMNAIKEVQKRLDTEIEESEAQYMHGYELAMQEVRHLLSYMPKNPGPLYQKPLDRLDEYYMLAKLRTMILAKNHDLAHGTLHDYRFEDLDPKKLAESVLSKRLTKLYHQLFLVFNSEDSGTHLLKYVETLRQEIPFYDVSGKQIDTGLKLAKQDAEILYGLGLNQGHYIKAREGNQWVPVLDDIFNQAIRKGAFLQKGKLYDRLFINQIQLLCVSGYLDLAESFFQEYVPILDGNLDNTVSDYCMGLILYFKEKMKKAWKLITQLKNRLNAKSDLFIASGTRVLLCALWYEIGEYDSMVHEAHAFRTWAGRETKRSDSRNAIDKRYCKLILGLERIIRGPAQEKQSGLQRLREEVQNGKQNGTSLLMRMIGKELAKLN